MEKEKKVKSKKLQKEFDINKDLGYPGTIEDYYEEFHGPVDKGYKTGGMGLQDEKLQPGKEYMMKKGGMTKGQKKVGKVMSEFKSGKLKSSSGRKVTNPKQAIAIGLSEAGMSKKKMQDGGMVRGQGAAIRGTKFKGIF